MGSDLSTNEVAKMYLAWQVHAGHAHFHLFIAEPKDKLVFSRVQF